MTGAADRRRRVFVALMLGADRGLRLMEAVAAALGERAGGFRLPRGEGLHLTLAFLGDVGAERLAGLWAELERRAAGQRRPELALRGTGSFPGGRRARVLWLGVEEPSSAGPEAGRLGALRRAVLAGCAAAGFELEEERGCPFRPHVTVARPRSPRGARVPAAFEALAVDEPWTPDAVALVESVRGEGPARYEPIERRLLDG